MRLGVLVSGRGSNLEAILKAIADGSLPGVEPCLVIANRPGIRALDVASRGGVPARVFARDAYPDVMARDAAIGLALAQAGCEVAVLAGYDQVLRRSYFAGFRGPTLNIHPSLLPRHGGRGMLGIAVHRAVLEAGDAESGATIHEVTAELDAGPVVAQERIAVLPEEDADSLARRVLSVEHRLLVETLRRMAAGALTVGASASMTAGPRDRRAGGRI